MFLIRPLRVDDIKTVVDLEMKYFGHTLGREMLTTELGNPFAKFFVVVVENEVIGYIGAWIIANQAEIMNFLIEDRFWHQGIGQALYRVLEERAIELNSKSISLEVRNSNNRARNFYEKQGFKAIHIREGYYPNGEDAILMMKVLYEDNVN